jgi:hypothetical protein
MMDDDILLPVEDIPAGKDTDMHTKPDIMTVFPLGGMVNPFGL